MAGAERDKFLKRVMGTPDCLQIDGLGGSKHSTSKAAIIRRSRRPDADIEYTFVQIEVERDAVSYESNCGNISSGVGPFAIDEGMIEAVGPITQVRIYNTNTQKILTARVPVAAGKSKVVGDFSIPGVPGCGAKIVMDYSRTVGAKSGKLLPTGHVTDPLILDDGSTIMVTLCDVANPCVFVRARDALLTGNEMPKALMNKKQALDRLLEIQARACELMDLCKDWRTAGVVELPIVVVVSGPTDYDDLNGERQLASAMDLQARLLFLGKCHDSIAGTVAVCTAAASRVPDSVVNQILSTSAAGKSMVRIGHPLGVVELAVEVRNKQPPIIQNMEFSALSLGRTARRLMDGVLYVPRTTFQKFSM